MRASCMGNHHLQSTEDSPPSVLEINLRIHAMRAYHTVRTIGLIIETCSFSRKRRERKNCSLAQYTSESSVYCTVAQPTPAVEHSAPANARGRAFRAAPHPPVAAARAKPKCCRSVPARVRWRTRPLAAQYLHHRTWAKFLLHSGHDLASLGRAIIPSALAGESSVDCRW